MFVSNASERLNHFSFGRVNVCVAKRANVKTVHAIGCALDVTYSCDCNDFNRKSVSNDRKIVLKNISW